jgi:hypothetical protein
MVRGRQGNLSKKLVSRKKLLPFRSHSLASKNRRFISASPLLVANKESVFSAYKAIKRNAKALLGGKVIESGGIRIVPFAGTGKSHDADLMTFQVSFKGKSFFVKFGKDTARNNALALKKAESYLSKNPRCGIFSFGVLPHHLFYFPKKGVRLSGSSYEGILVSDFFGEGQFVKASMFKPSNPQELFKLSSAIDEMEMELASKGVLDANIFNCMYNPSNNHVYFFDLRLK